MWGAALTIGSTAMQMYGQYQQHQAQQEAAEQQQEHYKANRAQAYQSYLSEKADLRAQRAEQTRAVRQRVRDIRDQARQQQGTGRAAMAEAGVQGPSVVGRHREMAHQETEAVSREQQQHKSTLRQLRRQKSSLRHTKRQRISQARPGIEPSSAALAVNLGTTAMEGAYQYGRHQGHW